MNRVPFQFLLLIVVGFLLPNSAYAKEIDGGWGVILNVDESIIETTISEENRSWGSICELEDKFDSDFKITVLVRKTFSRTMDEMTLDNFAEAGLGVFRKFLGQNTKVLEKAQLSLARPGYQITLQTEEPKLFIVLYATVSNSFEYNFLFSFPAKTKERSSKVQAILEGIRFTNDMWFLKRINETGFSVLEVEGVKIPYPKGWKVFSADDIEELRRVEFNDHFYSKLFVNKEATHVFKSKYEKDQVFTMTLALITKHIELEEHYLGTRKLVNSLFAKDYGTNYIDKSQGKLLVRGRAYYNFAFETLEPNNYSTLYQFVFLHQGFTYMIKFKTPTSLFGVLQGTLDQIIDKIQY